MGVLAETADGKPAALPDLGHHERQVEEAVDGVITDHERAIAGQVADPVDPRLANPGERPEQRREAVDRLVRWQIGISTGWCSLLMAQSVTSAG